MNRRWNSAGRPQISGGAFSIYQYPTVLNNGRCAAVCKRRVLAKLKDHVQISKHFQNESCDIFQISIDFALRKTNSWKEENILDLQSVFWVHVQNFLLKAKFLLLLNLTPYGCSSLELRWQCPHLLVKAAPSMSSTWTCPPPPPQPPTHPISQRQTQTSTQSPDHDHKPPTASVA